MHEQVLVLEAGQGIGAEEAGTARGEKPVSKRIAASPVRMR